MARVAIILTLTAGDVATPNVTVAPASVVAGEAVVATASGIPPGSKHWLGVAPAGGQWSQDLPWVYVTPPQVEVSLTIPSAGEWEVVLYLDDGFTEAARSNRIIAVPVANRAPVWSSNEVIFEQGIAGAWSLKIYAHDPDGDHLTFSVADPGNSNAMAALGLTLDLATLEVRYDGRDLGLAPGQIAEVADGPRIVADDGRG